MPLDPGTRLGPYVVVAHDPDFDAIRDDPRFKALLEGSADGQARPEP